MRRKTTILIIAMIISMSLIAEESQAIFGGRADISKFCNKSAPRQTLVYVDLASIRENDVDWIRRIDAKLASSLMPSEQVTVIRLDSSQGTSEEIISACWPDYSAAEREQMEEKGVFKSFVTKNELKTLKEEQTVFRDTIKAGLVKAYHDGRQTREGDPRGIMTSLAADEARINHPGVVSRVILYSDLSQTNPTQLGDYSLNFGHAIFYAFGVSNVAASKAAWDTLFNDFNAFLAAYGSDLGITSDAPVAHAKFSVEFETTKSRFYGDMVLFISADGSLQDSYITVKGSKRRMSLLTGIFLQDRAVSTLKANTVSGLATSVEGEDLNMSGSDRLKGQLGHNGIIVNGTNREAVFSITAIPNN